MRFSQYNEGKKTGIQQKKMISAAGVIGVRELLLSYPAPSSLDQALPLPDRWYGERR